MTIGRKADVVADTGIYANVETFVDLNADFDIAELLPDADGCTQMSSAGH